MTTRAAHPSERPEGAVTPETPARPAHIGSRHAASDGAPIQSSNALVPVRGPLASDKGFEPGDICGEWRILEFITAGGMGEVYKAESILGGKKGALKVIKADLAEREDLHERFKNEAWFLAQLEHPNIVSLLAAGWHQGNPYLVMEWLDGVTLRDLLNFQRKPMDLVDALLFAIYIAKALVAAHAANVVHRDLKPENVFVLEDRRLKVLDFGIGKLTGGSNRVSTSERLGGVGTPHYAAPEQLARGKVDGRTDVYSLGLILVELVTGKWAFADVPGRLPPKDVARLNQIVATPNSLRGTRGCTESLAALVDRALSKEKDDRPTAAAFLKGLREERRRLLGSAEPVDEDSADEPEPVPVPVSTAPRATTTDSDEDSSLIRRIAPVKTDVLPAGFTPADPSSAANPLPPRPRTIPMAPPLGRPLSPETSTAGNLSTAGRSATLPPEPCAPPSPAASEPATAEATTAMPASTPPAPPKDDDAAARASLELASRPTLTYKRAAAPTRSLTPEPTHQAAAPPARVPRWAGPLVGVLLAFGGFAVMVTVRAYQRRALDREAAVTSAAAPSATAPEPAAPEPAATTASAPPPPSAATTAAEPAMASASPAPTGTPAEGPAAAMSPAPPATAAASTTALSRPTRPAGAVHAQQTQPRAPEIVEPEPMFVRRKPDPPAAASSATQNPHRMFGSAE